MFYRPSYIGSSMSRRPRRFDRNHDGIISKEELVAVFEKIMPDFKDIDPLLHQMDTNHDGLIQYEEFVVWICGTGSDRSRISAAKVHSHAETYCQPHF